jgi:pimeloyl-ACP methyl ester carboxylesterase
MTYTSYDEAAAESDDFTKELPIDERFKQTPVPLMVIFGAEDQIYDAELSIEGYSDVPGVQTEVIEGAGHAPQVEKPDEVAELIEGFALKPAAQKDTGAARPRGNTKPNKADGPLRPEKKKKEKKRG